MQRTENCNFLEIQSLKDMTPVPFQNQHTSSIRNLIPKMNFKILFVKIEISGFRSFQDLRFGPIEYIPYVFRRD